VSIYLNISKTTTFRRIQKVAMGGITDFVGGY